MSRHSRILAGACALSIAGLAVTAAGQGAVTPPAPAAVQQPPQGGRGQQPSRDVRAQPAIGTGSISGTVVTEGSGTAVRRARVTLSGGELRGGRSTITTDEGQFSFTSLPAGRFNLNASKAGYVDIAYGARRPGRPGTPIQLLDGQKIEKATIYLPRGSVITGVVVDEHGEPSPRTQVRVMRYIMRTGERTLQQGGQDQTDDRGIYRIYGLQPGEYVITATPANTNFGDLRQTLMAEVEMLVQQARAAGVEAGGGGERARGGGAGGGGRGGRGAIEPPNLGAVGGGRGQALLDRAAQIQQQIAEQEQEQPTAYAPVFYPGTTSASVASAITLGIGEERAGVDFQLQLVPTARVDGSVMSPDGNLPPGVQVQLLPADNAGLPPIPGMGSSMARVGQDGRFVFSSVTPGQYRLQARATVRQPQTAETPVQQGRGGRGGRGPGPVSQILWASTDIGVGGQDVENVVLNLQPGMTVSGRVSFEGTQLPPPADLTRVRVTLSPRGQQPFSVGGTGPSLVDATGRFTITGVPPGTYSLSANVPAGAAAQGNQSGRGAAGSGSPPASWMLKSAVAGGRDVLDFPLVIEPNQEVAGALLTFVDRTQEVTGTIQDLQGKPTAEFTIIIFPSDNRYWRPQSRRIMATRPGTDGRFTFRNLPAGDYRLTAVTDVEPGEWFNPDFLSQLGGASIPLSLAEGERKVQDIRLAGGG